MADQKPPTYKPTGPPIAYTPPSYRFAGIGAGQKRTGTQANAYLQSVWGKPLTAEQQQAAAAHIGYTDQTGNAEMTHDQYNKLMQFAAQQSGGQYDAYNDNGEAPQEPYPNEGPVYPQPYTPPTIPPAPTYTPATYQQQQFRAPSWQDVQNDPGVQFRKQQGEGAYQATAAASGMARTGRTARGLIDYSQNLASQEYQSAYNREAQTYGINQGERQFGYGAESDAAQAAYNPRLLDWNAQRENAVRGSELNYDRAWQRELYGRDDRWRQETYNRDDAWRREQMAEQRRQFLAGLGVN